MLTFISVFVFVFFSETSSAKLHSQQAAWSTVLRAESVVSQWKQTSPKNWASERTRETIILVKAPSFTVKHLLRKNTRETINLVKAPSSVLKHLLHENTRETVIQAVKAGSPADRAGHPSSSLQPINDTGVPKLALTKETAPKRLFSSSFSRLHSRPQL